VGRKVRAKASGERRSVSQFYEALNLLDEPPSVSLDKPILIWQTQGIDFPETRIEPGRSSAKFVFHSEATQGFEEMSFYFLWQNPNDRPTVIRVDSQLVLNGLCAVNALPGFLPTFARSDLFLNANLFIFDPPSTAGLEPKSTVKKELDFLHANPSGGILGLAAQVGLEINREQTIAQLRQELYLVAPKASTLFEVTLSMSYGNASGRIIVNFAHGDFAVLCPGVVITILN
jgi:hypothetical protein